MKQESTWHTALYAKQAMVVSLEHPWLCPYNILSLVASHVAPQANAGHAQLKSHWTRWLVPNLGGWQKQKQQGQLTCTAHAADGSMQPGMWAQLQV